MEKFMATALVMALLLVNPAFATEGETVEPNVASANQEPAAPAQENKLQVEQHEPEAVATKLDINKASIKELLNVQGINVARAKAIVHYRKHHGAFKNVQDIRKLHGFNKLSVTQFADIAKNLAVN